MIEKISTEARAILMDAREKKSIGTAHTRLVAELPVVRYQPADHAAVDSHLVMSVQRACGQD